MTSSFEMILSDRNMRFSTNEAALWEEPPKTSLFLNRGGGVSLGNCGLALALSIIR